MSTPAESTPSDPRWRLAVALGAVLAGVLLYRQLAPKQAAEPVDPSPTQVAGSVDVEFVSPGVERREQSVAWSDGMTVQQATQLAGETTWRGQGEMALLESIDGVSNQGADGLNWQLWVNGQYATRGAGAYPLEAGDRVLWKLAPYE